MAEETESIDLRPPWLVKAQVEGTAPIAIEVDGKTYNYTLVRKGLEPELHYTVGFRKEEHVLFISEDVLPEYRPFILRHEIREATSFSDLQEGDKCLKSLLLELEEVETQMPDRNAAYVADRRIFFNSLVEFYTKHSEQANARGPEFLPGIKKARDHLNSIDVIPPGVFSEFAA